MNREESLAHDLIEAGSARLHMANRPRKVVFWSTDAHGACEVVSANWRECTGQPLEAARGAGWLDVVVDEDRGRVAASLHAAIAAQRGFFLHYRVRTADGSLRKVLHEAAARTLPSGAFNGLFGTLIDDARTPIEAPTRQVFGFLDRVPLAAVAVDPDGKLAHANPPMADLLGVSADQLLGQDWINGYVNFRDGERIASMFFGETPLSALPHEVEYLINTPQGERLFRWYLTLVRDAAGLPISVAMMGSDITQWRHAGDHLRLTEHMFKGSKDAMVITDRDNRILSVNPAFTRLTGYSREEVIGQNPRVLKSDKHDPAFYKAMWRSITDEGYWRGDIWDRRKDGSLYPKYLSITAIHDDAGTVANYSAIFYDISERIRFEEELENLAHFDMLTRLPNRMLLQDRLEQAIALADRQKQHFALLFVDLDAFKPINDHFGHDFGDEVLKEVGRRLQSSIRTVDTAARLGGDEFVVILNDIGHGGNASAVANKIMRTLAEPYQIAGETTSLSASIGVTLYPDDELPASELLRHADQAMYKAKKNVGPSVVFHREPGEEVDAPGTLPPSAAAAAESSRSSTE